MARINESDAKAAVKVWADNLIKENGVESTPITFVLEPADVVRALNHDETDGAVLTTPYFLQVASNKVDHLFLASNAGSEFQEYVLLVRRDGGCRQLEDLRGKSLMVLDDYYMSLWQAWLDVALAAKQLPLANRHLGLISLREKPTQAVLPVFFKTADACLVSKNAFDVMVELNPQVGKQLTVIATSPKVVSGVCCLSTRYQSPVKAQIIRALRHMSDTAAGRQLQTVFQFGGLVERSPDSLQSARELLAEQERLIRREAAGVPDAPTRPPIAPAP